jgi:hypothetical protein
MIEVYNDKDKLEGFIDGKQYLNKKKKKIGFIEKNEFKDKSGYTLLYLLDNGDIDGNEGDNLGYIENGNFFSSADERLIYEILREKGEINNSNGDKVLYLKGDFNDLEDLDYFGIVGQFLELFS